MNCREVRELAGSYVTEQLPVDDFEAVAGHLDRCSACHDEVTGLRRLRAALRSAVDGSTDLAPTPQFTAALRSDLRAEAMRGTRASPPRRTWLALAASVVLLLGSGFGLRTLGVNGFTAILEAAVGDHRYCLVAFRLTERPISLDQAAQVYDDPVDRLLDDVQPPPAPLGGGVVHVVERHSCVFGGRRFAHIVLRYKRQLISLVVTPDERLLRRFPGASAPGDGSVAMLAPVDGFHVAAFRGPDHVVFLISALEDADLHDVAQAMEGPVSRALGR